MTHVVIFGSNEKAQAMAALWHDTSSGPLTIIDQNPDITQHHAQTVALDITNPRILNDYFSEHPFDAAISCLPATTNLDIATLCLKHNRHYLDQSGEVATAQKIAALAKGASVAIVPQCGLAPGLANIIAYHQLSSFETVQTLKIRVGALPAFTAHNEDFTLSPSSDGLQNAYVNRCRQIIDGHAVQVNPLEGLEHISLDGIDYEAFNTSGGIGSLYELLKDSVQQADFKSLRYPGYCQNIKTLLATLDGDDDFKALDELLLDTLPAPQDDIVIIHIEISGDKAGKAHQVVYHHTHHPQTIRHSKQSAAALTPAACTLAVLEVILNASTPLTGYLAHQDIPFNAMLNSRFGAYLSA